MTRARLPRPQEIIAARSDPRLLRAILERDSDPAWRARGACRVVDPEIFFPAPHEQTDTAVRLCVSCEVQGACLAWALTAGDCHGVWGATTPRERRAMLVAWHADVGAPVLPLSADVAASISPFSTDVGSVSPLSVDISSVSSLSVDLAVSVLPITADDTASLAAA